MSWKKGMLEKEAVAGEFVVAARQMAAVWLARRARLVTKLNKWIPAPITCLLA